jgi:hypothetical protein
MQPLVLSGSPVEMGRQYGQAMADRIMPNVRLLVWREGEPPLPRQDAEYRAWVQGQAAAFARWPWLIEEMRGVAEGVGVPYDDILELNLRAWQYDIYGATAPAHACSSLAVTLADGTLANAGALDDPAEYYCGPVKWEPVEGYRFISFPITGTSWGNRGVNSAGLAVGISSQVLPGLRRLDHAINQDLALRVMLQTCATVDEVRRFCQAHPFTINLVVTDAQGGLFCAHQTAAGMYEFPVQQQGYATLTNHVADDGCRYWLQQCGVSEFSESDTTRERRGYLLAFAREHSGRCTAEAVRDLVGARDDANPGTIHNHGSIAIAYCNTQADPGAMWLWYNDVESSTGGFVKLDV